MRAQRLVPTALAVMALILGGCSRVEESEDGGIPKGNLVSLFEPTTGTVPFPFDGLFSGFTDPTLNIPSSQPPAQAANELDGWSTTASIFTDFIGFLISIPPQPVSASSRYPMARHPRCWWKARTTG
ncbi:hypothetical protein [Algiphilus sp.]|uniref:hypothetical protein n=1 Tax=Algiphilus sp. TaxID=1872431 RepID=UPI003BAA9447